MSDDDDALALEMLSTTVLYDIFQDAADALRGRYLDYRRKAASAEEAAEWWAKVMELRDEAHRVGPYDRDQLIAHTRRWWSEAETLKSPLSGSRQRLRYGTYRRIPPLST